MGERQLMHRQRREKGEMLGMSLLIVHVLMMKRAFPSLCAEQQIAIVSFT